LKIVVGTITPGFKDYKPEYGDGTYTIFIYRDKQHIHYPVIYSRQPFQADLAINDENDLRRYMGGAIDSSKLTFKNPEIQKKTEANIEKLNNDIKNRSSRSTNIANTVKAVGNVSLSAAKGVGSVALGIPIGLVAGTLLFAKALVNGVSGSFQRLKKFWNTPLQNQEIELKKLKDALIKAKEDRIRKLVNAYTDEKNGSIDQSDRNVLNNSSEFMAERKLYFKFFKPDKAFDAWGYPQNEEIDNGSTELGEEELQEANNQRPDNPAPASASASSTNPFGSPPPTAPINPFGSPPPGSVSGNPFGLAPPSTAPINPFGSASGTGLAPSTAAINPFGSASGTAATRPRNPFEGGLHKTKRIKVKSRRKTRTK
jgi:hypothetical protein